MDNQNMEPKGSGFSDFMNFKKLISTTIIQFIYGIGVLFITINGLLKIFEKERNSFESLMMGTGSSVVGNKIVSGLLIIVVGNLLWRVLCEASIVIFSMHDTLSSIEKEQKKSNSFPS